MIKILIAILFAVCFAFGLDGKVVKVTDGDTITILTGDKKQVKIRLNGIDAPELKQDFGRAAREHLASMIAGKFVSVKEHGQDRYKRVLGTISLDGVDINEKMVKDGYAWAFVKYSKKYTKQEAQARGSKVGLWQDQEPIAPWEFRNIDY